jgi:hypothetical protein
VPALFFLEMSIEPKYTTDRTNQNHSDECTKGFQEGEALEQGRHRKVVTWMAACLRQKLWLTPANVHVGGNRASNVAVEPWWFGVGIKEFLAS